MADFYSNYVSPVLNWLTFGLFLFELVTLARRPLAQRRKWSLLAVWALPTAWFINQVSQLSFTIDGKASLLISAMAIITAYIALMGFVFVFGVIIKMIIIAIRLALINKYSSQQGYTINFGDAFELAWSGPVREYRNNLWRYDRVNQR